MRREPWPCPLTSCTLPLLWPCGGWLTITVTNTWSTITTMVCYYEINSEFCCCDTSQITNNNFLQCGRCHTYRTHEFALTGLVSWFRPEAMQTTPPTCLVISLFLLSRDTAYIPVAEPPAVQPHPNCPLTSYVPTCPVCTNTVKPSL